MVNKALDKRTGKLDIGLSYYQEESWVAAIKEYGAGIMDRSLLGREQKLVLDATANSRDDELKLAIAQLEVSATANSLTQA